ncbi:carboxymuconolactone decarboxylase [Tuber brumale]|nr:carboxymuconolactone decarboxylase [Tuber brumale]
MRLPNTDLSLPPNPAESQNAFFGAIRNQTLLPGDLLELAICRIAVINRAHFQWTQHAPLALTAGVTPQGLRAIRDSDDDSEWEKVGLTEKQRAVVGFASESTRNVRVSDATFERVRGLFLNREAVEITAVVGAYNCVSRFLVSLDVGEGNPVEVKDYEILGEGRVE